MKSKAISQHYRDQEITNHFRKILASLACAEVMAAFVEQINTAVKLVELTDAQKDEERKERGRNVYKKLVGVYRKLANIGSLPIGITEIPGLENEFTNEAASITSVTVIMVEISSVLEALNKGGSKDVQKIIAILREGHEKLDCWVMSEAKKAVIALQAQPGAVAAA